MKNLFKSFIFISIFCILFFITFKIFWLRKNPISYFYEIPKDSIDVVYIGASNVFNHFNTTLAFEEYGYTTGLISYNATPFISYEYLLKEFEGYQHPKLYIIDIGILQNNYSELTEGNIRGVTDSIKNSKNRDMLIKDLLSYTDIPKEDYIYYYYSFFTYHDIWKDPITIKANLLGNKAIYKGYNFSGETIPRESVVKKDWNDDIMSLNKENIEVLNSLLKYLKSKNLPTLFVVPLKPMELDEMKQLNDGIRIIEEAGYEVLNFNKIKELDIDYNSDFFDKVHLNTWGATKNTLYFSKYLNDHYDLPDHRLDDKYSSWHSEYLRFKKDFNRLTSENFDELLNKNERNSG